jgi:catechol 2,3-dioxygenase-like lactoylglutathione lyase family enzyme
MRVREPVRTLVMTDATGRLRGLDHLQIAMPRGEEAAARAFYSGVLGLPEVAKPAALAGRGGCWFAGNGINLHLGVEDGFRPARKAHPAFVVEGLADLAARCRAAGAEVIDDDALDTCDRVFVYDPFGNRIELMEPRG